MVWFNTHENNFICVKRAKRISIASMDDKNVMAHVPAMTQSCHHIEI
jgi:hypothetical protein